MASAFLDRVSNKALGELLVEKGALSETQVNEALEVSREKGIRLGEALVSLHYISRDALGYAIGEQYGLTPMELQPSMVDMGLVSRFDFDLLSEHTMLPLIEIDRDLVVVVSDPNNQQGLVELARRLPDYTITPQLGEAAQIRQCLEAVRPHAQTSPPVSDSTPAACNGESLHPRELPFFAEVPEPDSPQFAEWLMGLAASHHGSDVLVREISGNTQISLTPSAAPENNGLDAALSEIGVWPGAKTAVIRNAILQRAIPLEHTRGQAARWVYSISHGGECFDLMVLMPITHIASTIRIRALTHLSGDAATGSSASHVPLDPVLEAGRYTVILYDKSVSLERALVQFIENNAANHTFVIAQQSTRCIFPHGQAYPAPFANMVTAVQASAATCAIFDFPVEYNEAARLLTNTYPPPAVLVCAPLPSHAAGAGSLSPDVEELISRQGAQSVRLGDSKARPNSQETTGGND